jgi:hypothetical protein
MAEAVPHWQRAVVAIGAFTAGTGPRLVGSGFIIDAEAGILATCAHVIEDIEVLQGLTHIVVGLGSPIQWRFRTVVRQLSSPPAPRHSDNGLDLALLQLTTHICGTPLLANTQGTVQLEGLTVQLEALPLGDSDQLQAGEPIVVLGYGQPDSTRTQTSTNTQGVFSAIYEDERTGKWLRTDALVLAGHSGGPALDRHGSVVGWNVQSSMDRVKLYERGIKVGSGLVPSGLNELRPVNSMLGEVAALFAALEPPRQGPSVRELLRGAIPAGTYSLEQAVIAMAERSATAAAVSQAAATGAAGAALGAATDARASASAAAASASGAACAVESAVGDAQRAGWEGAQRATMQQGMAAAAALGYQLAPLSDGRAVPLSKVTPEAMLNYVASFLGTSSGLSQAAQLDWQRCLTTVQADISSPTVRSVLATAPARPDQLMMIYIDENTPQFDKPKFCQKVASLISDPERELREITSNQIRVERKKLSPQDRRLWAAQVRMGKRCFVRVKVSEDGGLITPSYSSSSAPSEDTSQDGGSSSGSSRQEEALEEAVRLAVISNFFPGACLTQETVLAALDCVAGPVPAHSLWLAIKLPLPLALVLFELARSRCRELLDMRVRCVRLLRSEIEPHLLAEQSEIAARLDDRPDIQACEATLEREEPTVWDKVRSSLAASEAPPPQADDEDVEEMSREEFLSFASTEFSEPIRAVLFATNYYAALGLTPSPAVDVRKVNRLFRKRSRDVHPDKCRESSPQVMHITSSAKRPRREPCETHQPPLAAGASSSALGRCSSPPPSTAGPKEVLSPETDDPPRRTRLRGQWRLLRWRWRQRQMPIWRQARAKRCNGSLTRAER